MLFDSHVHFESLNGDDGLLSVIQRAELAGVTRMIAVGGSSELNHFALEAATRFPKAVGAALGYDRDQAHELLVAPNAIQSSMSTLKTEILNAVEQKASIAAIGEIGLDFHYRPETARNQIALFRSQLELAGQLEMPVIVHSREAEQETIAELRAHRENRSDSDGKIGVLHCFTGSRKFVEQLLEIGYHIGFSGIITFKNASDIQETAKSVPDDRLLIETDSPYLAPSPHRGKRNEPAYVQVVAEKMAELRGCSLEALADLTTRNAQRLFGIC